MSLLLIDDDIDIYHLICAGLKSHEITYASNLEEARNILKDSAPKLILLDVLLPDGNGFDFYEKEKDQIEALRNTPIVFLTSRKEDEDLVKGYGLGAIDYIFKPFTTVEIQLRVESRLRQLSDASSEFKDDNIHMDLLMLSAKVKNANTWEHVSLTKTEFQILYLILKGHPNAVKRQDIIKKLWENLGVNISEHVLNTHVSHIRSKLGDFGQKITTLYGEGYLYKT